MPEEENVKKPSRFKRLFGLFFWSIFITGIVITIIYINFEFGRLKTLNLSIKEDWKSFVAYMLQKVPVLKDKVKYEYLDVGNAYVIQEKLLEDRMKEIDIKNEKLKSQIEELNKLSVQLSNEASELAIAKQKLEEEKKKFEKEKEMFEDYKYRIKKLSEWFASSTPSQIALALSRDEVSIDLIVNALLMLPSDTAAEIVQALAQVNPTKAANVISKIGEVKSQ
ncbi:hypothetical protein XO10_09400 [Marinitoga sp. 1135]|uniref:Magnesium transporter MgtE intracellular domain-containing protein n=1 Tax=Marinitoga piezophila (strain DSM 14283 / JCM 11233 / KA3) TaxID=443254 RepID=H2J6D5_MARPK|nr:MULTISPECIES: hypothetical protein [Marinitoga]AEX86283.1 hypothetical protein Marpi_1903 [Marinitoga piezophila KA3]APT76690.1 hypothetical protein LN42_10090 [Marinitoga sp. 1137]NUU96459.1 hypothetical protein [Marinitoga sp. 1135]NUU98380.1 hypothetical protein [Marinitoga sp. 1138]